MGDFEGTAVMRRRLGAAALVLACTLLACNSGDDNNGSTATSPPDATPTVEATPTPEPPLPVNENGYTIAEVFPNIAFDQMLGLYTIPGDKGFAVVLTQDGVIYRANLEDDSDEPTVFLDIRDRIKADLAREEGLLGLAFAPDYETTGNFYIRYTKGGPKRNVVSRFVSKGDAADPTSETVLLEIEQRFPNHNAGALAFGPDGMLYIASGDGGSGGDPDGNGQNTDVLLGKILRIDVSTTGGAYTIPPDNPFASGGGRPEIWTYGMRNPWRMAFDEETGALWAADVGQGDVEEIDLIERGENYGWNIMEGPECYQSDGCDQSGLTLPRAWYGHEGGDCSVTGGYVYRGTAIRELNGWYIYGDYCSGRAWGFDTEDAAATPVLLAETNAQITSFAVDASGELYLVTFNNAIYRLVRAE
jgi:glucose/arabinose dehydrogenase